MTNQTAAFSSTCARNSNCAPALKSHWDGNSEIILFELRHTTRRLAESIRLPPQTWFQLHSRELKLWHRQICTKVVVTDLHWTPGSSYAAATLDKLRIPVSSFSCSGTSGSAHRRFMSTSCRLHVDFIFFTKTLHALCVFILHSEFRSGKFWIISCSVRNGL